MQSDNARERVGDVVKAKVLPEAASSLVETASAVLNAGGAGSNAAYTLLKHDYETFETNEESGLGPQHEFKACKGINWDLYKGKTFNDTLYNLLHNARNK